MIRTYSGVELGLAEPTEMDAEAYQAWLTSLQGPNRTWLAGFRAPTVAKAAGITYRQLDYWARRGEVLVPEIVEASGSGSHRLYSFEDICRGALMSRLVSERKGFTVEAAARATARIRSAGQRICDVAGVFLPTDNGPLVFDGKVSAELEPFVVMTEQDVFGIAAAATGTEVALQLSKAEQDK